MRCETLVLTLFLAIMASLTTACDIQTECQAHYHSAGEIDACVAGAQKGNTLVGAFAGAGHGGGTGYVVMSNMCADGCKQDYSGAERTACTQSCQARASYLLTQQSSN